MSPLSKPEWIILVIIIVAITILELVALCVVGLDGIALSGTVAALTSIAIKQQDIRYKIRGALNGTNST